MTAITIYTAWMMTGAIVLAGIALCKKHSDATPLRPDHIKAFVVLAHIWPVILALVILDAWEGKTP